MKKLIDIINDEKADKETISTGFKELDRLTQGFRKSDLIYIGARPAMGKTTFAVNLAENIAMSGKKSVSFSLELSDEMLAKKFSTANSDMEIYIDDTPGITVSEMNQKIKNLKDVDCVVIDYFGLIRPEIKRTDKMQECHDISRKLRKMANELDIPIICTTTVARNENYGERPRFSDLLDGGRLEFYADIFMFLHRNSYYFCEIDEDDIEDHRYCKSCSTYAFVNFSLQKLCFALSCNHIYSLFKGVFIYHTGSLSHYISVFINKICGRETGYIVIIHCLQFGVIENFKFKSLLFNVVIRFILRFLNAVCCINHQKLHIRMIFVCLIEIRHFLLTVIAPGCPEIQYNRFSFIVGKSDLIAIIVKNRKIRCSA